MLEDPSYSEIVRWGDEGDSFVVLEVMHVLVLEEFAAAVLLLIDPNPVAVREIYENHPSQTFQTQQLCQLCTTTKQVRLPQSETK